MDLDRLFRLKGTLTAAREAPGDHEASLALYERLFQEVRDAVDEPLRDELERLFPQQRLTGSVAPARRTRVAQGGMQALTGWLDGVIEGMLVHERIEAEAKAKARQTGFA